MYDDSKGDTMKDYVAWLGKGNDHGQSVAVGTLSDVERRARELYASPNWQVFSKHLNTLRITRGKRQLFVKVIEL